VNAWSVAAIAWLAFIAGYLVGVLWVAFRPGTHE
jgi:cbb3-type cytochrome oxidase subunit 3